MTFDAIKSLKKSQNHRISLRKEENSIYNSSNIY